MQLLARFYVFSILCLASLAAPLSQESLAKRKFAEKGTHFETDSVTASETISATLDELTQGTIETPSLSLSDDAISVSATSAIQPTSVGNSDSLSTFATPPTVAQVTTIGNSDTFTVLTLPTIEGPTEPVPTAVLPEEPGTQIQAADQRAGISIWGGCVVC